MYQVEEDYVDKVARFINSGDPLYGRKPLDYQEAVEHQAGELAKQIDKDIRERMMSDGMTEALNINPHMAKSSAWDEQVGGGHYMRTGIQPMRYSMENDLNALQHTIIKYVTRYQDKNGIEDLRKAHHCIRMLIEWENEK